LPKPVKGHRLGAGPSHERLMLAGLAAALFREERIRTTETKAKRLRPLAERLITLGKNGTVHARRQALSVVEDRDVIHKLFAEIAPRYAERPGGYTRILKLGPRKGDAAPMALIELVEGVAPTTAAGEEPRRAGVLRRRRGRGTGRRRRSKAEQAAEEGREEAEDIEEESPPPPESESPEPREQAPEISEPPPEATSQGSEK
jgi:large subunit ribosomal protein L17